MTCGVYGLIDPGTGLVRFVGAAWNIEKRYKAICEKPWAAGVAKGWDGHNAKGWMVALYRTNKKPNLQILQKCNEEEFTRVVREHVEIYALTGEADLNAHKNARSRNGRTDV